MAETPGAKPEQKRRHFARDWLKHSVSETSKSTRRASLGVAAAVGVLTGLVNWVRSWHSGHPLSPWGLIWPGLVVGLIVLATIFLFHFFAAPFRMARVLRAGHQADLATAQEQHQADLRKVQQSHLDMERKLLTAQRDVHSRDIQIEALQREAVSPEHLEQIKRICRELATDINGGAECTYDDPKSSLSNDRRTRMALEVHCSNVVEACDEWNDILQLVDQEAERLEKRIELEVDRRFRESPWYEGMVGPLVLERVKAWARTPNWTIPAMTFIQFSSKTGISTLGGDLAMFGGYTMLAKPGGLTNDEVQAAQSELNGFVEAATKWSEATMLSALYAEEAERSQHAKIEALRVLDQHSLPKNGGCPLC